MEGHAGAVRGAAEPAAPAEGRRADIRLRGRGGVDLCPDVREAAAGLPHPWVHVDGRSGFETGVRWRSRPSSWHGRAAGMDALPAVPCRDGLAEDVEVLVSIDALFRL